MAFSRNNYDKSAYDLQIARSTTPGDYRLFAPFAENVNEAISYDGPVGSKSDVSLVRRPADLSFGDMAAVESELSWRSQVLKKSNDKPREKFTVYHKDDSNKKLISEDTRFTHPIDNYRGMSLTELMMQPYLYINSQCNTITHSDKIGLNSRLSAKDCFKAKNTLVTKPWDKGEAFPADNKQPDNSEVVCSTGTCGNLPAAPTKQ